MTENKHSGIGMTSARTRDRLILTLRREAFLGLPDAATRRFFSRKP